MSKRRFSKKFQSFSVSWTRGDRGTKQGSPFTLAQFARENSDDAFGEASEIIQNLARLRKGGSYTFNGGAGGLTRFQRVR